MNNEKFFTWCRVAVKGIKYRPDRDAVHKELYEHLEDRYESFRSRGLEHEEAIDKTVEAMGSAEDVALQLAKIHRTFWLYLLRVSRVLLIVAVLFTVGPFISFLQTDHVQNVPLDTVEGGLDVAYEPFTDTEYRNYDGTITSKQILSFEPKYSGSINSYPTSNIKVELWHTMYRHTGVEKDTLFIRLETEFPYSWTEISPGLVELQQYVWAKDSLGRYYYAEAESVFGDSCIYGLHMKHGKYTHIFDLALNNYVSQDAQWIELHYDRDGRDYVLRINLPGGETS